VFAVRVRSAEAVALHAEGLTMHEIAAVFDASRQRVSVLLCDPEADPADLPGG
jgi:hypothetical protein